MRTIMIIASSALLFSTAAIAQDSFNSRNDRGYGGREGNSYQNDRDPSYLREERSNLRFRDRDSQALAKQEKASVKPEEADDNTVEPAEFFFRDGDRRIRIQCDTRETMKACVEAASTMFEKFKIETPRSSSPSISEKKPN